MASAHIRILELALSHGSRNGARKVVEDAFTGEMTNNPNRGSKPYIRYYIRYYIP
jgi:hypothetical protein